MERIQLLGRLLWCAIKPEEAKPEELQLEKYWQSVLEIGTENAVCIMAIIIGVISFFIMKSQLFRKMPAIWRLFTSGVIPTMQPEEANDTDIGGPSESKYVLAENGEDGDQKNNMVEPREVPYEQPIIAPAMTISRSRAIPRPRPTPPSPLQDRTPPRPRSTSKNNMVEPREVPYEQPIISPAIMNVEAMTISRSRAIPRPRPTPPSPLQDRTPPRPRSTLNSTTRPTQQSRLSSSLPRNFAERR